MPVRSKTQHKSVPRWNLIDISEISSNPMLGCSRDFRNCGEKGVQGSDGAKTQFCRVFDLFCFVTAYIGASEKRSFTTHIVRFLAFPWFASRFVASLAFSGASGTQGTLGSHQAATGRTPERQEMQFHTQAAKLVAILVPCPGLTPTFALWCCCFHR